MNSPLLPSTGATTRRDFLKTTGRLAAASALAGVALPRVHAAGSDLIQIALIGCGGRGTGAANQALNTKGGPTKLVAMADIFPGKLQRSLENLKREKPNQVDVPRERQFMGLGSYKQAMDCLRPGDIAISATPPAFRWVHYAYAIPKGLHVFMEKPITVDAPTSKRMIALAEEGSKKNLKAGVGLMIRHCRGRMQLKQRIDDGEIGDLTMMRAYRMQEGGGACGRKPGGISELYFQIQRFHSFLWSGGAIFSDYNIHQVDEVCWMKGAWPVSAMALGGRHYRGNNVDQNFDLYSVEYTFADGTKFFFDGRTMPGCHNEFASYVHGTKGSAVVSTSAHTPGRVRSYQGHVLTRANQLWAFPQPEPNPYQTEWDDLVEAIRKDEPYNEVKRGVEASLVTTMGRMAAHTGQIITWDQMQEVPHEFAPGLDQLTEDSPAPLTPDSEGRYPVPEPGRKRDREY